MVLDGGCIPVVRTLNWHHDRWVGVAVHTRQGSKRTKESKRGREREERETSDRLALVQMTSTIIAVIMVCLASLIIYFIKLSAIKATIGSKGLQIAFVMSICCLFFCCLRCSILQHGTGTIIEFVFSLSLFTHLLHRFLCTSSS